MSTWTREEIAEKYTRHVNPGLVSLLDAVNALVVEGRHEGPYIWDVDGRKYLDCITASGTYNVGHRNPYVIKKLVDVLQDSSDLGIWLLVQEGRARLAEKMAEITPGDLQYTIMMNSGSEANDVALKFARGATKRTEIIHADHAYHGITGFAMSATRGEFSDPFRPLIPGFKAIPYNDIAALEEAISERTAAVFLEPIQGEGGIYVPEADYLPKVRALCDRFGAKLILDEVQTGWGRTGRMFCCEHYGVVPDVMTTGKSLGGGVYPVAAVTMKADIAAFLNENPLVNPSTFGGNPMAAAVGLAVIEYLQENRLADRAAVLGERLLSGLKEIQSRYPEAIVDVRGKGLMIGVEYRTELAGPVMCGAILKKGVIAVFAGYKHSVMRVMPTLTISEQDVDTILEAFDEATKESLAVLAG